MDHLRPGVQDQPGQHGKTSSLLKIQKLAACGEMGTCSPSYSGGWGRKITWTWEAEIAVIMPLHSSLGDRARLPLQKKGKKRKVVERVRQLGLEHWARLRTVLTWGKPAEGFAQGREEADVHLEKNPLVAVFRIVWKHLNNPGEKMSIPRPGGWYWSPARFQGSRVDWGAEEGSVWLEQRVEGWEEKKDWKTTYWVLCLLPWW